MGQRVATNSLIESIQGQSIRPVLSTTALNPSVGSIVNAPPNVSRLVGVDYQMSTKTFDVVPNTLYTLTFPTIGFPGLLSSTQRFFNTSLNSSGISLAAPNIAKVINSSQPTTNHALNVGQSTQLLLVCSVNQIPIGTLGITSAFNLTTDATSTNLTVPISGPWFPSGVSYTGFSVTPSCNFYSLGTYTGLIFTVGVSAQLYAVFVQ